MSLQLPRVATGYFSTAKLNQALDSIEDHINNKVVHRQDGQTSMYQVLDMNGNSVINVETGDTPNSLVNREYVDRVLPAMEAAAADSASSARTSELNASDSKDKALEYEQMSLQHAQTAFNHLKEFKGIYLGPFSEAPSTDSYGNPINVGDLYFNTILNEVHVYNTLGEWKAAIDANFMQSTLKAVADNANNHLKLKFELMQKGVI